MQVHAQRPVAFVAMLLASCGGKGNTETATIDAAVTEPSIQDAMTSSAKPGRDGGGKPDIERDAGVVSCTKTSCDALLGSCGSFSDGCGGTISCECSAPFTCGGAGVSGRCGLTPKGLVAGPTVSTAFEAAWTASAVAFSPNDTWLAVGGAPEQGNQGGLKMLSATDLTPASEMLAEAGRVVEIEFAPGSDQAFYAVTGVPAVKGALFSNGQLSPAFSASRCHEVDVVGLAVNRQKQRVGSVGRAFSGGDTVFCEHDFSGAQTQTVTLRGAIPYDLAYEPSAGTRLALTDESRVRILAPTGLSLAGEARTAVYGGNAKAFRVAWLSSSAVVFALDRALWIAELLSTGFELDVRGFAMTDSSIRDIATHPAVKTIATHHADGTIRLFDPETRIEQARVMAHSEGAAALSFSSNGRQLASVGKTPNVALFTME